MGRVTWHGSRAEKGTISPLAAHIGSQLLKLRQKHQLSMRAVADATGLSNAFICQVENGQSCPTADTLWKLAKAFGVSVGDFFEGHNDEP